MVKNADMNHLYLDYNASAPMRPETVAFVAGIMGEAGNASSVHSFGRAARKHVEDARAQIAGLAGVRPQQVIFNGGATEGNNTALHGLEGRRVLVSAIEHPSVLEAAPQAERIPVLPAGVVDMDALKAMLDSSPAPAMVSVMRVNSETGVIQPVREIAALAKARGALVHVDAVQAAGRIPLDFNDLGADMMTLSAHKIGGPQGVGALIFRNGLQLPRLMRGGTQETHQRAGTQNVAGIAGFGHAAQIARESLPGYGAITALRDRLETALRGISNEAVIYGENAPRVGNTTAVGLPGVSAQTQLMALDLEGIAVSSGSACSSGAFKPSHVLMAMGVSEDDAQTALRISLGWATTSADIDRFVAAWETLYRRTKKA